MQIVFVAHTYPASPSLLVWFRSTPLSILSTQFHQSLGLWHTWNLQFTSSYANNLSSQTVGWAHRTCGWDLLGSLLPKTPILQSVSSSLVHQLCSSSSQVQPRKSQLMSFRSVFVCSLQKLCLITLIIVNLFSWKCLSSEASIMCKPSGLYSLLSSFLSLESVKLL